MGGVSGIFVAVLPAAFLLILLPEPLGWVVCILIYVALTIAIYDRLYTPYLVRIFMVTFVNLLLAFWSLGVGQAFIWMSRQ